MQYIVKTLELRSLMLKLWRNLTENSTTQEETESNAYKVAEALQQSFTQMQILEDNIQELKKEVVSLNNEKTELEYRLLQRFSIEDKEMPTSEANAQKTNWIELGPYFVNMDNITLISKEGKFLTNNGEEFKITGDKMAKALLYKAKLKINNN